MFASIYALADQQTDDRNQAVVEAARKVRETLGEYGPYLPLI